jgi:hypothetical protein
MLKIDASTYILNPNLTRLCLAIYDEIYNSLSEKANHVRFARA